LENPNEDKQLIEQDKINNNIFWKRGYGAFICLMIGLIGMIFNIYLIEKEDRYFILIWLVSPALLLLGIAGLYEPRLMFGFNIIGGKNNNEYENMIKDKNSIIKICITILMLFFIGVGVSIFLAYKVFHFKLLN
jgi:hypothetical protein